MSVVEKLAAEAELLPKEQKLALARLILHSADSEEGKEGDFEAAWDDEIQSRIRKYDAGETRGISGEEVFRKKEIGIRPPGW